MGQREIHCFENHVYFLNHILPENYQIEIALIDETVIGMIAYNESEISQLYIHIDYQAWELGKHLDKAKAYKKDT